MLFKVCILQIAVYLFLVPILRNILEDGSFQYSYPISVIYIIFFLVGGLLTRNLTFKNNKKICSIEFAKNENSKWWLFIIFVAVCTYISFSFGLYDPRIGTEEAALRISNIPPIYIIIFKGLGVSLPFFIALTIKDLFESRHLTYRILITVLILAFSFFIIGGGSSRSAFGLYLLMSAVILQNNVTSIQIRSLVIKFLLLASISYFFVTFLRLASGDSREISDYFSAEVLQRLDGLEVISYLIGIHGYRLSGIDPFAISNPIIASIPFLDASVALKAAALTTVKSTILLNEYDSSLRDINAFIILDVYYWGGVIGLAISAFIFGFLASWVDNNIELNESSIYQLLMVSIILNMTVMERESISLVFGIVRDFLILWIASKVFLFYKFESKI